MADLTLQQLDLARHALGLPNRRKRSYRNHFVTGPGSSDYKPWTAMVAAGLAKQFRGNPLSGGDPVFVLTVAGAKAALKPGERLDPEDFPQEAAHG